MNGTLASLVLALWMIACGAGTAGGASKPGSAGSAGTPAFPGAEGFGALSLGGRLGDVYRVTRLDDAGPGTLREAIETAGGPRTIVFDVAGSIALRSPLLIDRPTLTIAGQTAPGAGITLRDEGLIIRETHDIVVRHLRIRRGDVRVRATGRPENSRGLDTVSVDRSRNVMLDHLSLSWSCDEILGIVKSENVSLQWSLIAEPLGDEVLHPYGREHAYALNASANTLSVHHNLFVNYVTRGPQFEPNDAVDAQGYDVAMEAVSNVLFDYKRAGSRYKTGIEEHPEAATRIAFRFQFVNNLYLRGPEWAAAPEILAVTKYGVTDQLRVHASGNIGPNRPGDDLDPWASVTVEGGAKLHEAPAGIRSQLADQLLFQAPVPVTATPAETLLTPLLATVGAHRARDAVDERVLSDVSRRSFRDFLKSQSEVGGWPALAPAARSADWDTDRDGMPDAWERAHALNPNDADDGNADADADGYTNLEEYLNDA